MCLSPRLIDNPYFGLKHLGLNRFHDCSSLKIKVPCGYCPTCISLRQSYFVQRCQMESLDRHLFMCTLTYRQSQIPSKVVNGYKLYYPLWSDVQNMFKRLRNRGYRDFRYFCVSEYGGNNHRPHFHFILSLPKSPNDRYHDILNLEEKWSNLILGEWRRNYGSKRKPIYKDLCKLVINTKGSTFDFHHIEPSSTMAGEGDVAFYVTKYLLKADSWLDKLKSALKFNTKPDEFVELWKLFKPKCCCSKNWGNPVSPDVVSHICKGIDFSKKGESLFPYFINPISGQTFPLAPYYRKRFMSVDDLEYFYLKGDDTYLDTIVDDDDISVDSIRFKLSRFDKVKKMADSRNNSYDFVYDDENTCIPKEALQKNSCGADCLTSLPDDWQNDFDS